MKKGAIIAVLGVVIVFLIAFCILFFQKKNEYTVVFNSDGGTQIESQKIKDGEVIKEPTEPTKEGFTFEGWYYTDNQDTKYDFNNKVNKDIILIAKWKEKELTSAKISASKTTLEVDEELELNLKTEPQDVSLKGKKISWLSSDKSIVEVDENGKIKAVKAGSVTITANVENIKATIEISVKAKERTNTSKTNTNTNTNNKVTYTYKWEDIGSVVGQMRLYIVSSTGKTVAGTVTLTSTDGDSITETIPADGKILNRLDIASVTNIVVK